MTPYSRIYCHKNPAQGQYYFNADITIMCKEGDSYEEIIISLKLGKYKPNNPYSLDKQISAYQDSLDAVMEMLVVVVILFALHFY